MRSPMMLSFGFNSTILTGRAKLSGVTVSHVIGPVAPVMVSSSNSVPVNFTEGSIFLGAPDHGTRTIAGLAGGGAGSAATGTARMNRNRWRRRIVTSKLLVLSVFRRNRLRRRYLLPTARSLLLVASNGIHQA